jgi:hypothetical protein
MAGKLEVASVGAQSAMGRASVDALFGLREAFTACRNVDAECAGEWQMRIDAVSKELERRSRRAGFCIVSKAIPDAAADTKEG